MKYKFVLIFLTIIVTICMIYVITNIFYNDNPSIEQNIHSANSNINVAEKNVLSGETDMMRTVDNVTMLIKEGTLTNKGAVIIISDKNKLPYSYGKWYRIDSNKNGEWVKLEPKNKDYIFDAISYQLGDDGMIELEIDWTNLYGKLKKGQYRLVKEIGREYMAVEFSID